VKRLVIEGAFTLDRDVWTLSGPDGRRFFIDAEIVTSVEDIPDPLPTEPGERFWGKARNVGPQWWFVTRAPNCRNETIDYVCQDGHRFAASLMGDEATRVTRLPDPKSD
jgi:hypothetical protein